MYRQSKITVLVGCCAADAAFAQKHIRNLVAAIPPSQDAYWLSLVNTLHSPRLERMWNICRSNNTGFTPIDLDTLDVPLQGEITWNGDRIGEVRVFYKSPLPHEAQARMAYDIFFERFCGFLARNYKTVILQQDGFAMRVFVPDNIKFDLSFAWNRYVAWVFSIQELNKSFVASMNSIKVTSRGISAIYVPIVSADQALVLSAFYLKNIQGQRVSIQKDQGDYDKMRRDLTQGGASKRQIQQSNKKIESLGKRLSEKQTRFQNVFARLDTLAEKKAGWFEQVAVMSKSLFSNGAGCQISPTKDKINACLKEMERISDLKTADFFDLPALVYPSAPNDTSLPAGDGHGKFCYCCGKKFEKDEVPFPASRTIFEYPSQRTQSGSSQTQPNICANCSIIAFASPIKLGEQRVVVRMRERGDEILYGIEDRLRMMVLGELNVVAGKYALIKATETVATKKKRLYDELGGLQYAIQKVATLFEPEVLEQYIIEAIVDGIVVELCRRHLLVLHHLIKIFGLDKQVWNREDAPLLIAFRQAIQHAKQDELVFAVYELMTARSIDLQTKWTKTHQQLERLRSDFIRWLTMDEQNDKAQLFRDVSAMTGLLYAFCNYAGRKLDESQRRIAVRKIIERCDDPYSLNYTIAGITKSERATLFRSNDMHFAYDTLKEFLPQLGIDVQTREKTGDKEQRSLELSFDDVIKAYTYLLETRYPSPKDQRNLFYQLKLSLHARFPELIDSSAKGE